MGLSIKRSYHVKDTYGSGYGFVIKPNKKDMNPTNNGRKGMRMPEMFGAYCRVGVLVKQFILRG